MTAASAMVWLVVLSALSVALGAEVHVLGPSTAQTAYDANADVNNPTSLFPGPTSGLPGYKESHDWVKDLDVFNPLVFDDKWFALRYELGADTQPSEVRQAWLDYLEDTTAIFPAGCKQGNPLFSPNKYFRANPDIADQLETNDDGKEICGSIVKVFLKEGIFDAAPRFDSNAEEDAAAKTGGAEQVASEILGLGIYQALSGRRLDGWALGKSFASLGEDQMVGTGSYTLAFWYQPWGARAPECNILHRGNSFNEKAPMISQAAGGSTRLKFVVAQTNNNDWECSPSVQLVDKQWSFIVLKVQPSEIQVSYDGQTVCNKQNSAGTSVVYPHRNLYVSSPWQPPASGVIQKISYYPYTVVSDDLIKYQYQDSEAKLSMDIK